MEWIRRLLCTLVWAAQGPVWGLCLDKMIPVNEAFSRKARLLMWTVCLGFAGSLHAFFLPGPIRIFTGIFQLASPVVLLILFYRGHFLLRLGAFALLLLIPEALDILLSPAWCAFVGKTPTEHYAQMGWDFVFIAVTIQLIAIALQGVVCNIWCRHRQSQGSLRSSALLLGIALVGLCSFLSILFSPNGTAGADSGISMVVTTCMAFVLIGAVFVLMSRAEKQALRKNLDESRRMAELEQVHYASVEERREEMENIRHDYNNVLSSVIHLLEQGNAVQAQEMLSQLSDRVAATKEAPFCAVPIINAVLTEKEAQCHSHGIGLQTDFLLPENLSIRDLDLCSAFSNLLDNAIRACRREQAPVITLSCRVTQGYLVIKCTNPSGKAPGIKPDHTGYGLKILREIAQRYQGDFHVEHRDGIFTAQLSLLANQEGGSV